MTARMVSLKPGWLVRLSTSINGNTSYETKDITTKTSEDGKIITEWNTVRTTIDPNEKVEAEKIRGKCRTLIKAACRESNEFGLLCPAENKPALDLAIEQAQQLAKHFSFRAKTTNIRVSVLSGSIAGDDSQAIKALRGEVRDMIEAMITGLRDLDVEKVRDAASRATAISGLLTPDISNIVAIAVNATREASRRIVKAAKNGGSATADAREITILRASRFAFLEPDEANGTPPSVPLIRSSSARMLDFDDATPVPDLSSIPNTSSSASEGI